MNGSRRHLTFQLVGGLGNQLFGYFAGLTVARERKLEIRFDVSQFNRGFTAHGSDIQSFDLEGEFLTTKRTSRFLAQVFGFVKSSPLAPKFLKGAADRLYPEYTSEVDGFDSDVFQTRPGSLIRGYFQSFVYLDKLRVSGNFKPLTLKFPSDWYKNMTSLLDAEKPAAIHLRRGDYRLLAEQFGLLSNNYYWDALQELGKTIGDEFNVWIYSDDMAAAKEELGPMLEQVSGLKTIRWIEPPPGNDPAESLLLMSQASANIISNSTFAWWGAALNLNNGPVIAPKKWFRGKSDPDFLYPEKWIKVKSTWVQ